MNPGPLSSPAAPARAGTGRYFHLSRIAFVLFLTAVGALLWLNEKNDRDEQQATLISDVLWLDQNVRFALDRNEEQLQQLALSMAARRTAATRFDAAARRLLGGGSGIRQVIWLAPDARVEASLPPLAGAATVGEATGAVPSREAFRLASRLEKPSYSPAYPIVGGDAQFEVHVPLFRQGGFAGMVVGVYSIRSLLNEVIPWWLAQRYRVAITDDSGNVLGAKTSITGDSPGPSYQLPFDPPGHGLLFQATAYRQQSSLGRNLLAAAIVLLAGAVLWSLWGLRRHFQRRQAAEMALREEHAFRKAMEDSLDTGLRARDLEGRITYVNPAFCRMVGWSAEELVGLKPPMPYWVPEDIERTRAVHDDVLAGTIPSEGIEIQLQRRDGERFDVLIHEAPLIDAEGRHSGWMGSVIDVSERKRIEELARQQQAKLQATARLVAMGEMASSLAHEINQPLAAIASYNAGVQNEIRAGRISTEEISRTLDKVGEQARRAGQVVRRIYEFVRRSEPRRRTCDVLAIVEDAAGLVESDARRHGIHVERRLPPHLPPIQGDPVLLGQVLVNLLRNAIDAMLQTPAAERVLRIGADRAESHIHIDVCDRGQGIADDIASRLFEPFFTTKSEGMGMGLNICRSIVESHEGRLWFEANPLGGTCFHVTLPAGGHE